MRTVRSVQEELPQLLQDRGLTQKALAAAAGVDPAHLSRALRGKAYKAIGPGLAHRIALALGLPEDYFPEARDGALSRRLRADPRLRDEVHDTLIPTAQRAELYKELLRDDGQRG